MAVATIQRQCPYFGLDYYEEEDGAWFFGRDLDTDRVVTNLLAARLTLLHAETGVGKSSLLRAGVARQLRDAAHDARAIDAPAYLPVVFKSWTDNPVQKLLQEIRTAAAELDMACETDEECGDGLGEAIKTLVGDSNTTLVLILDQFEEYFLYQATEQPKPGYFADQLADCVNRASVPASFLISIREEAYAGLGDLLKGRVANVYGNYLQIDHLDRRSAEKAIREPLEIFNAQGGVQVTIDDDLVEAVLQQARTPIEGAITGNGRGGASDHEDVDFRVQTPLLQLVMETVWQRERDAESTELRLDTLRNLQRGGLTIVDAYVNGALGALDDRQRPVAIDVLDHMVTPDGAKVAASIAQLAVRVDKPEPLVREILECLIERPLVRRVPPPPGQDPVRFQRYEIFHDVLAPSINREITVEAERRAIERRQSEEEGRRRLRKWRRRADRFRFLATLAVVLLVAAIFLALAAQQQRQHAVTNLHIAQSLQLVAYAQQTLAKDPKLSTLLGLEALSIRHTPQAKAALQTDVGALGPVFQGDTAAVKTAVFSPDGSAVLTASADGSVHLSDMSSHVRTSLSLGPAAANSAAFSPDGKRIVIASADGQALLGAVTLGRTVFLSISRPTGARGKPLNDAEFSPDGTQIVSAGADGTVRIWSTRNGREIDAAMSASSAALNSARFSPDGQLIVTAGADGTARMWSATTHREVGVLVGGGGAINSAAFNPSGTRIVTAGTDNTARIWNVATQTEVGTPLISTGTVYTASYSPDGRLIVTTSADNTARIWDASSGRQLATLRGSFSDATFNPTGTMIVTAGLDQKVRINGATVQILIGPLRVLEQAARKLVGDRKLTPTERATYLAGIGG